MKHILPIFLSFLLTMECFSVIKITEFENPPKSFRPIPLWFWNNSTIEESEMLYQFRKMIEKDGYGGCAILPFGKNFKPEYLSESYFSLYKKVIEEAAKLDAHLSIYDEYGFPSGSMGAYNGDGITRFKNKYPESTIKRLDKYEYITSSKKYLTYKIPSGKLMSAVAMDTLTNKRISLKSFIKDSILTWKAPGATWKLFLFVCVNDGDPNVDYLDPKAVNLFIQETHQKYYNRFSNYFGNVIKETFFDEPTMYRAKGRIWTPNFNTKFEELYGYSPELLYPALWYNIGEETQSARNSLYSTRALLYAEGFMKTIQEWAERHKIRSTGHQDQEEIENPVSVSGDLMLCSKYIGAPGIDRIGGGRPTESFYKLISSSAYNWDKQLVMSETYGDMGNISVKQMYHIAIEQYAKGINALIPHAVWYNEKSVVFLPELSWRNKLYRDSLPAFNKFLTRLNYLLRPQGRHIANIAILYPIETLQGEHTFDGPLGNYEGGWHIENTDYTQIANLLTDKIGADYTYLHPKVLQNKCIIKKGKLHLNNKVNKEDFQILILPSIKTISLSNLKKIAEFQKAGGSILFTTQLPEKSVEIGKDKEVKSLVQQILTANNSKAIFIKSPNESNLRNAIKQQNYIADVEFEKGKELNYLHKIVQKQSIYYFANLKDEDYEATIKIKGKGKIFLLNPHTGTSEKLDFKQERTNKENRISFRLSLKGNHSVFVINN